MATIRQAVAQDWPAIARFVAQTYGQNARYKSEARWRWQMEQAPFALASADHPPSWIAVEAGQVVGQTSLQPTRLHLGSEIIEAGWNIDVMVAPHMRGRRIGHQLHDAILDAGHCVVTLTMAEATRRIAERAGCITLPAVGQFLRPQGISRDTLARLAQISAEHGGKGRHVAGMANGPVGALAALGLRAGAALLHLTAQSPRPHPEVEEIALCDPQDIDALFAVMRAQDLAMFDRSAQFWRWRFEQAPDLSYRFARRVVAGETRGLIVWREPDPCEHPVGTIVEVLADREDKETIDALIGHAVHALSAYEALVAGAGDPAIAQALRRAGFLKVKSHHPTIASRDTALLERISSFDGQWHLSKADHDWDQIHAVR